MNRKAFAVIQMIICAPNRAIYSIWERDIIDCTQFPIVTGVAEIAC